MSRKLRRPTWLFDLDNTLHDASHAIFPAINLNMNAYIARVLQDCGQACDTAAVDAARIAYWQRYGATLLGMIKHHQVKPDDFLREAHRFDDLTAMIRAERNLARILHRLPGRKILLTNAPRGYARTVLRHLGLHRHFARHVPIEAMRVHGQLRPKPSKPMLRKLLAAEGLRARLHLGRGHGGKPEGRQGAGLGHRLGHAIPEHRFDTAGGGGRTRNGQAHKTSCLCRCQSTIRGETIQTVAQVALVRLTFFQ